MTTSYSDRFSGISSGLAIKAPVRVATTANITLSGEQTIDGVAVVSGNRVLVKDQTNGVENGIYTASTGVWTRATDFNGLRDVVQYTRVIVGAGTTYAGREFQLTTASPVIGTSSLTFTATLTSSSSSYIDLLDTGSAPSAPASGYRRVYSDDDQIYVGVPSGTLGGPYKIPTQTTGSITVSTTDDWLDIITRHEGGSYIYFNDGTYDFSVAATGTISAASWSGGSATITHNGGTFICGESVTISGVGNAGYNGTFTVTNSTSTTLTYTVADPGGSSSGGTAAGRKASNFAPETSNLLLRAVNVGGATLKNMRIVSKGVYYLLWGFDILPPDDGTYWFSIYEGGIECFDCCMDITAFLHGGAAAGDIPGIGYGTMADFKVRSVTRDSIWSFGNRVDTQVFDIDSGGSVKHGYTSVSRTIDGGSWANTSLAVTGATWDVGTATATLTHAGGVIPVGTTITVAGMNPAAYDGTFTVTETTATTVSYSAPINGGTFVAGGTLAYGTATITHNGDNNAPIVGSAITVSSVTPSGYNGTYTVMSSENGEISYCLTSNPGAYTSGGTVDFQTKNLFTVTNNISVYIIDTCLGIMTGTEIACDFPDPATHSILSGTWSGGTATLIHDGTNSYPVGSYITVAGAADSDYNGTFLVTASSSGSVSYADSNPGTTPIGAGGTIVPRACGTGINIRRNSGLVLANYCRITNFDIGVRVQYGQSTFNLSSGTSLSGNAEAIYLDRGGVFALTDGVIFENNSQSNVTNYEDTTDVVILNGPIATGSIAVGKTTAPNTTLEVAGNTSATCTLTGTITNGAGGSGTILDATVSSGTLAIGDRIWGATINGVGFNTIITAFLTGTGGTGTYTVSNAQFVSPSITMYACPSGEAVIRITNTDTSSDIAQLIGAVEMYGSDASTGKAGVKAYMAAVSETIGSDANMILGVADNVSNEQAKEKVRLTPEGVKITGGLSLGAPVTATGATYPSSGAFPATANFLICNRAGTITVTLPDATATNNIGRIITVKTVTANTVVSASSNVVPVDGTAAGTAILAATAGKWATLVSDGTNWVIMQAN